MIIKNPNIKKKAINLSGPEGNAYNILGIAKDIGKQLEYSDERIESILNKMMEKDYNYLIDVFEENFGEYVILYN